MRLIIIEQPELLAGANQPQEFELVFGPALPSLRVGRQLSNDITLLDSSVSRQHAELTPFGDIVVVRDLGSRNGTFINNEQIAAKGEGVLHLGDQLRLGKAVMLLALSNVPAPVIPGNNNPTTKPNPENKTKAFEGYVASNNGKSNISLNGHGPTASSTQTPPPVANNELDVMPAKRRDASELLTPEQSQRIFQERIPPVQKRRGLRLGVIMPLTLLFLLIVAALIVASVLILNTPSTINSKITLPLNVFSSPANSDAALGIVLARPSSWKRRDLDASKIVFSPPNSVTAAFTIEKAPSSSISSAELSPEEAIKQYVANVRRVGQNVRLVINPASTNLKDGTAANASKLIFTTDKEPVVTDYNIFIISFKCGDNLYFVSAGEEGRFYRDTTQQDLEAAIASVACK